jgi:hypothetical protein
MPPPPMLRTLDLVGDYEAVTDDVMELAVQAQRRIVQLDVQDRLLSLMRLWNACLDLRGVAGRPQR